VATTLLSKTMGEPAPVAAKKSKLSFQLSLLTTGFLFFAILLRGIATLPLDTSSLTSFQNWLNSVSDWIGNNRTSNPVFTFFINVIRDFIDTFVTGIQDLISQAVGNNASPLLGWFGIVVLLSYLAYAVANVRIALLVCGGLISLGLLGYWQESMDTLALTLAAVVLALIIGIPLGVCAGLFPRFEKIITPALDFAQVMPTFVYLTPVTLFFLIGPASATIVTMVYAIPPALRITAVALHEVPWSSVEAAVSMGSTRMQALRKVQLPQAKRTIVVGINQTIMAALSMVTIAALIDAPGLGKVVIRALESLDIGSSFQAGLGIVILAVVLDRTTTAAASKVDAENSHLLDHKHHRQILKIGAIVSVIAVVISRIYLWAGNFPGTGVLGHDIATYTDNATNWFQAHFVNVTNGITNAVSYGLLNPLQSLLTNSPWFVTGFAFVLLAAILGGRKLTLVAIFCVLGIVGTGLWSDTMATLASVLVASIATVTIGIVVGVWIGRSKRADQIIRPILDAGQVLPAFVYLVPFLGLFGATRFTAIMAAIVYAAPASIKLMADGIAGIPASISEAGIAAGSSKWQMIIKVQLPSARRAVALSTNQGIIYVLAMVVVGGLVGAGGLGYLVVAGFAQLNLTGKGLAAGLAIVLLGILLDRITQAAAVRSTLQGK